MIRQEITAQSWGNALVILDRDGVINRDRPNYVLRLDDCQVLDGALEGIARLSSAGYQVAVATNQSCIGRGLVSANQVLEVNRFLSDCAAQAGGQISAFYVCPHVDKDQCGCRKPKPLLLTAACDDYQAKPEETWFIGDAERDVEAAVSAGCRPALISGGIPFRPQVPRFDDLLSFALFLTGAGQCRQAT